MRLCDMKAHELPVQYMIKCLCMILDIILHEEDILLAGCNLVIDLDKLDYQYMFQASPYVVKSFADLLQSAYPLRIKQWHFINAPAFSSKILNMLKFTLNKKIASRVRNFYYKKYSELAILKYCRTILTNLPRYISFLYKNLILQFFCYSKEDDYKMLERVSKVIVPKEYDGDGPTIQEYIGKKPK